MFPYTIYVQWVFNMIKMCAIYFEEAKGAFLKLHTVSFSVFMQVFCAFLQKVLLEDQESFLERAGDIKLI